MKINLRIINDFFAIIIIAYSFVFAGFLQFFIGVSLTITSLFLSLSFLFWQLFRQGLNLKKEYSKLVALSLFIILYILVNSLVKGQGLIRPIIYSQFYFLPVALLLLFHGNGINTFRYLSIRKIRKFLLYLALFQLPVLLIQINFYDFLIAFNNSGQSLASVDFEFGTFPMKDDHSLGFFLVVNLLYIWSYDILRNRSQQLIASAIILVNLLLTNSNVSILFAIFAVVYLVLKKKEEIKIKISLKKILIASVILITTYFLLEHFEPKFYYDLKVKLSHKLEIRDAFRWLRDGLARREQIVLVFLSQGVDFTGHGAYAYFDILTGEFYKTFNHFSQLIWTYFDLGLIGLILFFAYVRGLSFLFTSNKISFNICLTFALLLYSFFSIITFDISFMLTYFIYKNGYER